METGVLFWASGLHLIYGSATKKLGRRVSDGPYLGKVPSLLSGRSDVCLGNRLVGSVMPNHTHRLCIGNNDPYTFYVSVLSPRRILLLCNFITKR